MDKLLSDTGLATRIAVVAATLTVIFTLLVGVTSYVVTRTQIAEGIQSALDHNATLLAGRFSSTLGSVVNTLSPLKDNDLILNSLMDSLTRDTSLEPFLADFSTVNGVPVDIVLTDFEGVPVAGEASVASTDPAWVMRVLREDLPYVSVARQAAGVYLIVAEPVHYRRTKSTEGALVHRIDLSRLIADFTVDDEADAVRLLQRGQAIIPGQAAPLPGRSADPSFTIVRPLELPALLDGLGLALELRASSAVLTRPLRRLTLVYVCLGLLMVGAVIALSMLVARHLARPLRQLEQVAATVVASGSYDHRFLAEGYTEVVRLGETFNRMLESLGAAHVQLERLASRDALTGLANRSLFQTRLRNDLLDIRRSGKMLGILLLDLDRFKDINDTLGHPVGDELLKVVARRLGGLVRSTDTVARLGGDEFAVVATHVNEPGAVAILGAKIVAAMAAPLQITGRDIHISVSVGIAVCPSDGADADQLLRNADMALYKAKAEGRGNYQFFDAALNTAAQSKKRMEAAIRAGLDGDAFRLHYQPKIELASGAVVGVEALVRWQQDGRFVPPDAFIPVAEDSGLIVPLGEWIMGEACRQKLRWEAAGLAPFSLAVNLSAGQLHRDACVGRLLEIIDTSGVSPQGLEIEITESVLMKDIEAVARRLGAFRERGIGLAIDDIGTGYSSLSMCKRLSVDVLKIDRSFIDGCAVDADDAAITNAVIQLGRSLDLQVVAEGIETADQAAFVSARGCHLAQGYLYSPALSAADLAQWLEDPGAPLAPEDSRRNDSGVPAADASRLQELPDARAAGSG